MLHSFRHSFWAVLYCSLAVLATPGIVSSSWREPNVTLSFAERAALASAALGISSSVLATTTDYRHRISRNTPVTVFYQMADFDSLTNQTSYGDVVEKGMSETTAAEGADPMPPGTETRGYCSFMTGSFYRSSVHSAIRAYMTYQHPAHLQLANESWAFARSYTISQADAAAGHAAIELSWRSNVGWNFQHPTIWGFLSTYFLAVSALMAGATSDPIYLNAALDSLDFITAQLFAQNLVLNGIAADSCTVDNAAYMYINGLFIEGLAVLYSITNNASTQALLNEVISATISNEAWQTPDGIIAQGEPPDPYLVRGLAEAYVRNAVSGELRQSVHDFIGVQFNAVVDLATEGGTAVYGGAWTGPPSAIFSQANQTAAISALLAGMALNDVNSDTSGDASGSAMLPSPSPGTPDSVLAPHVHRKNVAVIAGSVVGACGVLLVLGMAGWYTLRRRRKAFVAELIAFPMPSNTTAVSAATLGPYGDANSPVTMPRPASKISPHFARFDLILKRPAPDRVDDQPPVEQLPAAESNMNISPTALGDSDAVQSSRRVTAHSPNDLPTVELVRLLTERLRSHGGQWEEGGATRNKSGLASAAKKDHRFGITTLDAQNGNFVNAKSLEVARPALGMTTKTFDAN
ncbi:hypothetical protein K438DRAFT_1767418 [Mycena galopus ATCC 62051]|nr:hypothetical protein K438DRAFT_1767418 [Mycena galopus ATCC 62051]